MLFLQLKQDISQANIIINLDGVDSPSILNVEDLRARFSCHHLCSSYLDCNFGAVMCSTLSKVSVQYFT